MSVVVKGWTLRFHVPGTVNPSIGTRDFDVTEFAEPPHFGGQVVDPSRGSAATVAYRFVLPDLSGILTGNLADASGRTDLIGRLVELIESTDGAAGVRVFVGRCSALTELSPGRWQVEVSDERWQERQAAVFEQATDTVQLYPPGPRYSFRMFPAVAEKATARVAEVSGTLKKLVISSVWEFTPEVIDLIERDVIEEPEPARTDGLGNFEHLRIEVNGSTLEVLKFGELDADAVTDRLSDTDPAAGHNIPVWVVDSLSALGAVNTTYDDVALIAPTHEPSEVLPLLLGVNDASHVYGYGPTEITVWHLVEKLYQAANVRYDATRFAALKLTSTPRGAWRLTSRPRDLAAWLDSHVYGPTGYTPFTNDQGEISPRSTQLPDPATFDVNTAFQFTADNLTTAPRYDQDGRDLINVLRVRWERQNLVWRSAGRAGANIASASQPHRLGSGPADRIFVTQQEEVLEHDNLATVGRREATFDLSGYPPAGEGRDNTGFFVYLDWYPTGGIALESAKRLLSRELFERWGDGPIRWTFSSWRSTGEMAVQPGDFVVLNVGTIPNPVSNSRGGARVVQVLGKRPGVQGIDWEAIDAGPALQPLAAPVVSINAGTDPKHDVSLSVAGLAGGTSATVELALGASAPFTLIHDGKPNGTFSVRGLPSGTLIRARARATAPNRTRSLYSPIVSRTTTALAAPTVSSPVAAGWTLDVDFVNNEPGYRVMPVSRPAGVGAFADELREPLPGPSTFFSFRFDAGSTSYDVGFKAVDSYGGESTVAYQTDSTESAPRRLDEPLRIQVTQGRPLGLDVDLPPAELWTGTGLEIGFVPQELHADTIVQMSADSFATIESEVVVGPGETRVQMYTPGLDKTLRSVRTFHRARGNDDSLYSAVVSALPTALLGNQPPDKFAGGYFDLVERSDGKLGAVAGTGGDISTHRIYYEVVKNPVDPDAPLVVDLTSDYMSVSGASPATSSLPFSGQFPPDAPLDAVEGDVFVARARFWNKKAGFGQDTVDILRLIPPDANRVLAVHVQQYPIAYGPPPQPDRGDFEVFARCDVGQLVQSVSYSFDREEQSGSQIVSVTNTDTPNEAISVGGIDYNEIRAVLTVTPWSGLGQTGTPGPQRISMFWSEGASPEGGLLHATKGTGSIVTRPRLELPDAAFDWDTTAQGMGPTTSASVALSGTSGTLTVDRALGGSFRVTATSDITLTASNFADGQVAVVFAKMGGNDLTLSGMVGSSGSPWTGDCVVWIGRDSGTTWASVSGSMVAY